MSQLHNPLYPIPRLLTLVAGCRSGRQKPARRGGWQRHVEFLFDRLTMPV